MVQSSAGLAPSEIALAPRTPGRLDARWLVPAARDPRWPFAFLLALYAVLGCTILGFNRGPGQILLTVGASCGLDFALCFLLRRRLMVPLSAFISGLSLALLLNYAHGSWLLFVPVYLAIGSKYIFTFRGRHVCNPSLFGIAATLLLAGDLVSAAPAYQWGGSIAVSAFIVMAALVLFVLRIGRGALIVSFLLFYTLQTALRAYVMRWHLPPETLFLGTLTSAPFFLFTFYMLPDPQTSPSRGRGQIWLALAITLVDLWLHKRESLYTLYYAAFAVALARFCFLHARALQHDWRAHVGVQPWRALRPVAVVAAFGVAGAAAYAALCKPDAALEKPNFRFDLVPAAHSGISAQAGRTLEQVDPRLRHIAKWILSVGDAVAVGDFDNDGLPDIFVASPLKRPADRAVLYRNLGDFRFRRVPLTCLRPVCDDAARHGLISGAIFADYDNDGDQDLLLTVAFGPCLLLRNTLRERGAAAFVDATKAAGIDGHSISLAAQWVDLDRDGRLDLVVANAMNPWLPDYPRPTPLNIFRLPQPEFPGDRRMFHFMHRSWYDATNGGLNVLYRNRGKGQFEKLDSRRWGMPETHWSLAIGTGDLNHDGWTDLYIANDFGPDDLYLNRRGQGLMKVRGAMTGSVGRDTYKGMNASLGDIDRDGNLDIYVSNVHEALQPEGSLLWMTRADGSFVPSFSDEANRRGALNEHRFGWGGAMGDVNNDGWLDILQANGMVDDSFDRRFKVSPDYWYVNEKVMRSGPEVHAYADMWGDLRGRSIFGHEANRVYLNRGNSSRPQFVDVAPLVGWAAKTNSRGIALADFDNDGDLDAAVTHPFAPLSLFRNTLYDRTAYDRTAPHRPHWIGLHLKGGGRCNADAAGSVVTLIYAQHGEQVRQTREVQTANGFSAQGDRRLLFGLGDFNGPLTIEVAWHGGARVAYRGLRAGRYYVLAH